MKILRSILLGLFIFAMAGLVTWWALNAAGAKAAPAQPAETPPLAAAAPNVMTPVVMAPVKSVVAAPVAPPAVVGTAQSAPPAAMEAYQPQTDISGCIGQVLKFIQAKNYVGLLQASAPPGQIQQMLARGKGPATLEEMAGQMSQRPNVEQMMTAVESELQTIQGQTPQLSPDGATAIFELHPTANPGGSGATEMMFMKVDGNWYFGGEGATL